MTVHWIVVFLITRSVTKSVRGRTYKSNGNIFSWNAVKFVDFSILIYCLWDSSTGIEQRSRPHKFISKRKFTQFSYSEAHVYKVFVDSYEINTHISESCIGYSPQNIHYIFVIDGMSICDIHGHSSRNGKL